MKKKKLLYEQVGSTKIFKKNGCEQIREGATHSWWINANNNKRSSVPRHREIPKVLVHKICKDLGIPTK